MRLDFVQRHKIGQMKMKAVVVAISLEINIKNNVNRGVYCISIT